MHLVGAGTWTVSPVPSQHDSFILLSAVLLDATCSIFDPPAPEETKRKSLCPRVKREEQRVREGR